MIEHVERTLETWERVLHLMQEDPDGPFTAVRIGEALGIGVHEAQQCLVELEAAAYIARPSDTMYPFFHLTLLGSRYGHRSKAYVGPKSRPIR